MNQGANSALHRRFGYLFERVILHRQMELQDLEIELFKQDQKDLETEPDLLYGGSRYIRERGPFMKTLEEQLINYGLLLWGPRVRRLSSIS